jgi:acetyltransferase-like isoleucine patch superfamily enzyme
MRMAEPAMIAVDNRRPARYVPFMNPSSEKPAMNIQKELFQSGKSPLRTYQDLAVGRRGLGALLVFEFMQMFLRGCPGAIGLVLRRFFYRFWLGSVGRNVTFGQDIAIRHPHKIRLGDHVVIDDGCLLDAKGTDNRGIEIGSNCVIGRQSILHCKNGDIVLGHHVNIGVNCDITSSNRVVLGDKTLVAAYAYIVGGDHVFDCADTPVMEQDRIGRGIEIGAECWVGAHAVVLDGTTIGTGTIVGAGAVVTKSLPDQAIAAGVPARVVRMRNEEKSNP